MRQHAPSSLWQRRMNVSDSAAARSAYSADGAGDGFPIMHTDAQPFKQLKRAPPAPLQLFVPPTVSPSLKTAPASFGFSLPGTPTLQFPPPLEDRGFPSPFSVPAVLPPSPASPVPRPSFIFQDGPPLAKLPLYAPPPSAPAHVSNFSWDAAQVARTVALSALDADDIADAIDSELSISDSRIDPFSEELPQPLLEGTLAGSSDGDDGPRRKGRARMSQEKRRRLARRREREAAAALVPFGAAGVPAFHQFDYSIPRSAPPCVTSFDRSPCWQEQFPRRLSSPAATRSPSTHSSGHSSPAISPQKHFPGPVNGRAPYLGDFTTYTRDCAFGPLDSAGPFIPGLSLSPSRSGSTRSSVTHFDHSIRQQTRPASALDTSTSRSGRQLAHTPAGPPRLRLQPPTPQDALSSSEAGDKHGRHGPKLEARASQRLSHITSSAIGAFTSATFAP